MASAEPSSPSIPAQKTRLRSRAARQVTLVRRRYRLALLIQIIDNGPGIPEPLQARIFQPLVSGREGGSGLGLMLAQNFINQHHGTPTRLLNRNILDTFHPSLKATSRNPARFAALALILSIGRRSYPPFMLMSAAVPMPWIR